MKLRIAPFASLATVLLATACGSGALAELARTGQFSALGRELERVPAPERGELRGVARAVIGRELEGARGIEGERFVDSLALCAPSLVGEFEHRAERSDDVGYHTALVLFEAGHYSRSKALDLVDAADGGARALGTRALVRHDDHETRVRRIRDPETRVRRAAIDASAAAQDPRDIPALLEASHLDPDPMARTRAFVAIAAIGGEGVANRLAERYSAAPEDERLAILEAWASPNIRAQGGLVELGKIAFAGSSAGFERIHACLLLMRDPSEDAERAAAELERSILEGTVAEQRLAILNAPLTRPTVVENLVRLSELRPASEMSVIASARLLDVPEQSGRARARLEQLMKEEGDLARRARAALSVRTPGGSLAPPDQARLKAALRSSDAVERASAGQALLRLGAVEDTRSLLADPEPKVRTLHACRLLSTH